MFNGLLMYFKKEIAHDLENAKRFVGEDLPQATEALETFNKVKKDKIIQTKCTRKRRCTRQSKRY